MWDRPLLLLALFLLCQWTTASVLPRPLHNLEPTTTQLSHSGHGTIVLVTSSELPKQIPPPPTPTRPHQATPRYDTTKVPFRFWVTKDPAFADPKETVSGASSSIERGTLLGNYV